MKLTRVNRTKEKSEQLQKLEFWKQNLEQMLEMIQTVPPENVRLDSFRSMDLWSGPPGSSRRYPDFRRVHCGSVACLGGWLPFWPYFKALGVTTSPDQDGRPFMKGVTGAINLGDHLTGSYGMFFGADTRRVSHKQQAIRRIKKRLRVVKVEIKALKA